MRWFCALCICCSPGGCEVTSEYGQMIIWSKHKRGLRHSFTSCEKIWTVPRIYKFPLAVGPESWRRIPPCTLDLTPSGTANQGVDCLRPWCAAPWSGIPTLPARTPILAGKPAGTDPWLCPFEWQLRNSGCHTTWWPSFQKGTSPRPSGPRSVSASPVRWCACPALEWKLGMRCGNTDPETTTLPLRDRHHMQTLRPDRTSQPQGWPRLHCSVAEKSATISSQPWGRPARGTPPAWGNCKENSTAEPWRPDPV